MNPTPTLVANSWLTVFFALLLATLLSALVGWFVKKRALPLKPMMAFSSQQWRFIRIWVKVALVVGVILPLVMWVTFWEQSLVRQFFSCYLLTVAVQLACEVTLSRLLTQSVVVIIGTLYTGYRIWQVWEGLHLVAYPMYGLGLLGLVLCFWVANLIMLMSVAIPSIFPESEEQSAETG
ncbi:hypothetical protein [Oscillatoria sp. FACHB-1406]|uniref:hypothetical protein n=1 Tax=Oscillatoria sp. FACHB-1406 TaxID=2692846 RepID=UPI00168629D2|nr:hypothetical protein [Oscillatoria sp. FACHB-1406]MBD2580457.1 hypothetical protein [Oscillatoria sp. FACHB-1406]